MEDKTIIQLLGDVPKRFVMAISKLVGVKGAIWLTATGFLWFDKIEVWAWVVVSGVVIFGREFLKFMKDVR